MWKCLMPLILLLVGHRLFENISCVLGLSGINLGLNVSVGWENQYGVGCRKYPFMGPSFGMTITKDFRDLLA